MYRLQVMLKLSFAPQIRDILYVLSPHNFNITLSFVGNSLDQQIQKKKPFGF